MENLLNLEDLNFDDLTNIDGGYYIRPIGPMGAWVTMGMAVIGAAYLAGEKCGQAFYNATH